MRVAFFLILAVNLVYLAWAGWIDAAAPPPLVTHAGPKLPELVLVSETPRSQSQLARPVTGPDGGNAPVAQTVSIASDADNAPATSPPATRCVSVGPFNDLTSAARSAALLRERGFDPKQRAEAGELWEGFWVYVGGLKSETEEAKVMKALARAGISDAHAMPEDSEGRRVSVGLFTERDRAEKRAQAVKRLGYAAEIVDRKQPGTVYWVDLDLGANERTVPTEGLLSSDDPGSRLEIRVCPSAAPSSPSPKSVPLPRGARPAATTADAGAPQPG